MGVIQLSQRLARHARVSRAGHYVRLVTCSVAWDICRRAGPVQMQIRNPSIFFFSAEVGGSTEKEERGLGAFPLKDVGRFNTQEYFVPTVF